MSEYRICDEASDTTPAKRSICVERRSLKGLFGRVRWRYVCGCSYDLGDSESRDRAVGYCKRMRAALIAEDERGLGFGKLVLDE